MLSAADLAHALGARRSGRQWVCRCIAHDDSKASMIIFDGRESVQIRCLAGCKQDDLIGALIDRGLWGDDVTAPRRRPQTEPAKPTRHLDDEPGKRIGLARSLWSRHEPVEGTVVERYLREVRGIACALPSTLGYLPARGEHNAAMIAPFAAQVNETEPGVLHMPNHAVRAVHLTRLNADGTKIDKIMIGSPRGHAIVLSPMNDLLGLAITEGIEDALSVFQMTGLGVWAAGSASLLPSLADRVPDWCDCVSIFADQNEAGLLHSSQLLRALQKRSIHASIMSSSGVFR